MSWLTLAEIADLLQAPLRGADGPVAGVATDTRADTAGRLFFALRGPRFDAHELLPAQPDLPVAGLVVERPVDHPAPQIVVDDTRRALGRLAAAWRQRCPARVIALTGSNGKTTVKEMLAAIFSRVGPTLATVGNLNNDIGVPLTLLRLRPEHDWAVIEMGANHPGEIAWLTDLARPDVALVNNAGPAHLEGFGDLTGVATAKAEIWAGLRGDGVAVINADDAFAAYWQTLTEGRRRLRFGSAPEAEVRIVDFRPLRLALAGEVHEIPLRLAGRHNARNAAAAAAAALAAGAPVADIVAGLAAVEPVAGRLRRCAGVNGATLIDDSYNANPASLAAAIEVLAEAPGRRILVLGELAELGPAAGRHLADIGRHARAAGLDALFTLGEGSRPAAEAFGSGAEHSDDLDGLLARLRPQLDDRTVVLVKGSRAARMERVVAALRADGHEETEARHHAA